MADARLMLPGACGRLAVMTAPPCSAAQVFNWYVQLYGPRVNLFVDHSQVVQLARAVGHLWQLGPRADLPVREVRVRGGCWAGRCC